MEGLFPSWNCTVIHKTFHSLRLCFVCLFFFFFFFQSLFFRKSLKMCLNPGKSERWDGKIVKKIIFLMFGDQ